MSTDLKPEIFIFADSDGVSISAFRSDDPQYDNNHMIVRVVGRNTISVMMNTVRNVLMQTGAIVIIE